MMKLSVLSIGLMVLGCLLHAMENSLNKNKDLRQVDVSSIIGNLAADQSKRVLLSDETEVNQATLVRIIKRMCSLITHNPEVVSFLCYSVQNASDKAIQKIMAVCFGKDFSDEEMYSKRQEMITVCQAHKFLDEDQTMSDEIRSIITCSLQGAGIDLTLDNPLQNPQPQAAGRPDYNALTEEEKALLKEMFG